MILVALLAAIALTNVADLATQVKSVHPTLGDFDCRATVSCVIERPLNDSLLTLGDPTGHALARVKLDSLKPRPQTGDVGLARGRVIRNNRGQIEVWLDRFDLLHRETPAAPSVRSISELLSGAFDWQPACVCGEVRDAFLSETSVNWALMVLIADGQLLYVSTPLNGASVDDFKKFIGRHVQIGGFINPTDGSLRIYMGRIFHCPGLDRIRILGKNEDPFGAPTVDALRFLRPSDIAAHGRVRTVGRVICAWGDGQLMLRRTNGEPVQAVCSQTPAPKRGDFIEAVGFPQSDLFHITLTHALVRPVSPLSISEPKVKELSARDILTEDIHRQSAKIWLLGRTIRLNARVRDLPDAVIRKNLLLVQDGAFIVPVDVSAAPTALNDVRKGCMVSLTGTCVFETDNWRDDLVFPQIHGFRVILNDPSDLVVTKTPPWWTSGRLVAVIGTLLAALLGVFLWNRALNRLAERRGRQLLKEQIGHVKADLKTSERTRLAVELHDSIAQNLTGVSMELETAARCGKENVTGLLGHLTIAAKALKSCRLELRNTLWDLRNQSLDERDMDTAIRRTLLPHVKGVDLTVRFNVPRGRFTDNTAHEVLRIIRELVLNGIRHGGATQIKIAGSSEPDQILFSVWNNGSPFDPSACPGVTDGHFGLQGIRERLGAISGTLVIASAADKGTKATVHISTREGDS